MSLNSMQKMSASFYHNLALKCPGKQFAQRSPFSIAISHATFLRHAKDMIVDVPHSTTETRETEGRINTCVFFFSPNNSSCRRYFFFPTNWLLVSANWGGEVSCVYCTIGPLCAFRCYKRSFVSFLRSTRRDIHAVEPTLIRERTKLNVNSAVQLVDL